VKLQTQRYGLLTGPILMFPLMLSSMLAGMASNKFSRIWVMAGASILWSLAILATGFAQNYISVVLYTMIIGFACGFFIPPAISLIIDYFPVER